MTDHMEQCDLAVKKYNESSLKLAQLLAKEYEIAIFQRERDALLHKQMFLLSQMLMFNGIWIGVKCLAAIHVK